MHTYTEMKKQIEKIIKETNKLKAMAAKYERWQNDAAFTTTNARFASEKMQEIETACQGLEMVLI